MNLAMAVDSLCSGNVPAEGRLDALTDAEYLVVDRRVSCGFQETKYTVSKEGEPKMLRILRLAEAT